MKLAVITDSSAYLSQDVLHHDDLFILEIPIYIDGESYVCLLYTSDAADE